MWPKVERIPLEHRMNGTLINAHIRYTFNPGTEILSLTYVIDNPPAYALRAKEIYREFESDILSTLGCEMDRLGIKNVNKTRVIIITHYPVLKG